MPDRRIEKSAITASKWGHEVFFGGKRSDDYTGKTFSKVYEINWTPPARLGIPFYWHSVKKQVEKVLREVRPDIVHAHNIFSAKMMLSEFGLPLVFDDHEYWIKYSNVFSEMSKLTILEQQSKRNGNNNTIQLLQTRIKKVLRTHYAIRLWPKWERELVSSVPTITVSDRIAEGLRSIANTGNNSSRVFVVPNFPANEEVKNLPKPHFHTKLSCVYAGSDGQAKEKRPNRDIDGLADVFESHDIGTLNIIGWSERSTTGKITYKGFLPRQEMYNEMSKHSIGLIPWKKHWTHAYSSPNKAYEYAHVGLFVMCTSTFETVTENLKENCITFEDYEQLASQLEYFKENLEELYRKRLKIFEFARNELIWDKFENNIFQAYQLCC